MYIFLFLEGVLKLCKEERKKLVDGEGTTKKTARRKLGLNNTSQKTVTSTQRRSRTPNRSKITSTRSKSGSSTTMRKNSGVIFNLKKKEQSYYEIVERFLHRTKSVTFNMT